MGFHINHRHWGLCHLLSTHYIRLPVTWAANCYDFSDIFLAHHLLVHTVADLAHSGPIHGMRGRSRSRSSWCCAKCGCRSIEHEFSSGSSVHIWHASTICASGRLVHADRQESSLLHESVVSTGEPPCTHSLNHSLSLSVSLDGTSVGTATSGRSVVRDCGPSRVARQLLLERLLSKTVYPTIHRTGIELHLD